MAETATGESSISEYFDDYNDLSLSYSKMFLKESHKFTPDSSGVTDVRLLSNSILEKYKNDLNEIMLTKTFTAKEKSIYKYNPWRLSYDLYGSTEYWALLLDANNMYSATEFTQTTVNIYNNSLPSLVDSIMMAEEDFININNDEIDPTSSNYDINNDENIEEINSSSEDE